MKKSIRKFISANVSLASIAGILGGALTLVLAIMCKAMDNDTLMTGVIVAAAVTAVGSLALSASAKGKLNSGISEPVELMSQGKAVKPQGDVPAEIGKAAQAVTFAADGGAAAAEYIARIAEGDFTAEIPEKIKSSEIGESLEKLSVNINRAFGSIYDGANAVNTDGQQVSGASMTLSLGASEQADTLSTLTRTVSDIKDTVLKNAENAHEANRIVEEAAAELETGTDHMRALVSAMDNINKSTEEISEFVKVIEDIAFQTNILALNSSVEAARAGEAGKGFAVVAMEVKNLATRSQEAAQQTTAVIEECVRNVRAGLGKTEQTAKSITAVVEETKEISRLIGIISSACDEQSDSIVKIDTGVERINAVVQHTNNAAQECVNSAQQLAARSGRLKSEIGSFRFKDISLAPKAPVVEPVPEVQPVIVEEKPVSEVKKPAPTVKRPVAPPPVRKPAVPVSEVKKPETTASEAKKPEPAVRKPVAPAKPVVSAPEVKKTETSVPEIKKPAAPAAEVKKPAPAPAKPVVRAPGQVPASYANAEFVETPDTKY